MGVGWSGGGEGVGWGGGEVTGHGQYSPVSVKETEVGLEESKASDSHYTIDRQSWIYVLTLELRSKTRHLWVLVSSCSVVTLHSGFCFLKEDLILSWTQV